MSVRLSPSTSVATTCTFAVPDHCRNFLSMGLLWSSKVPSPLDKAVGSVLHVLRTRARSALPSALKSPATNLGLGPFSFAHDGKLFIFLFVTRKVPSPCEKAIGC